MAERSARSKAQPAWPGASTVRSARACCVCSQVVCSSRYVVCRRQCHARSARWRSLLPLHPSLPHLLPPPSPPPNLLLLPLHHNQSQRSSGAAPRAHRVTTVSDPRRNSYQCHVCACGVISMWTQEFCVMILLLAKIALMVKASTPRITSSRSPPAKPSGGSQRRWGCGVWRVSTSCRGSLTRRDPDVESAFESTRGYFPTLRGEIF